MPPNQIIIGLSLFLTFFIMAPVFTRVNDEALKPYYAEQISGEQAFEKASAPIKAFMLKQVREKDLMLFIKIAKEKRPAKPEDVGLSSERLQRIHQTIQRHMDGHDITGAFPGSRYGRGQCSAVHGYDDAAAYHGQPALQVVVVRSC